MPTNTNNNDTNNNTNNNVTSDDEQLAHQLGYKQELFRGVDMFSNFAVGFSGAGSWMCIIANFTFSLTEGGPGPLVWSFLIGTIGTFMTALTLSEICSAFPQAGSVYNWAGQLAPLKQAPFYAYWTGIFSWMGTISGLASWAYCFATFLSCTIQLAGYTGLSTDEKVVVAIVVLTLWSALSVFRVDHVAWFNNVFIFIQFASILSMVVGLFVGAPSLNSTSYVFFDYNNSSGASSQVYVVLVSIMSASYAYIGYDYSAHLAEEAHDTRVNSPLALLSTVFASMIASFVTIFALLYCMQDITDAISDSMDNAAFAIIAQACSSSVQLTLGVLITMCVFGTGTAGTMIPARVTFALLRDKLIPGEDWKFLSELHPEYRSPIYCIAIVYVSTSLFLLLPLASTDAFSSLCGMASIGLQIAYVIPIGLKLLHDARHDFPHGPINYGDWSIIFETLSMVWLLGSAILMFFPYTFPVTAANMNYNIVIVGGVVVIFAAWWEWEIKASFMGPKRHIALRQSQEQMSGSSRDDADYDAIVSEDTGLLSRSSRVGTNKKH